MSNHEAQTLVRAGAGSLAAVIRDLQQGGATWSRADVERWTAAVEGIVHAMESEATVPNAAAAPVPTARTTVPANTAALPTSTQRPPAPVRPAAAVVETPPPPRPAAAAASPKAEASAPPASGAIPPWARRGVTPTGSPPATSTPAAVGAATNAPPAGSMRPDDGRPAAAVPATPHTMPAIQDALAVSNAGARMDALQRALGNCTACELCHTRSRIVWGVGDPSARLMFIGEAPGADEDRLGEPFVGEAGALLDRMIVAMGLHRREVYIANTVKCRPPNNRNPLPEETTPCAPWLRAQIEAVAPEVIVALGRVPMEWLLPGNQVGITKLRGTWQRYENIDVMPTFHPAYLLRQPNAKREVWADLQAVMARLRLGQPPA